MSGCFLTNKNEVHCTACHRTVNLVTANVYLSHESFNLHHFHEENCTSFSKLKMLTMKAKTTIHKKHSVTNTLSTTVHPPSKASPLMSDERVAVNPATTPTCAIQPPILTTFGTLEKPNHPNYSNTKNRLNTYKKWPNILPPTPESLAFAGFFYDNNEDEVICFCCGNYLSD